MKTLKYRSAFAGLMVAALSVFLFTACEKDSDGDAPASKPSVLEKFQRLTFNSGSTSTSTSSTSSGTFTGGGGSISYTPPSGGNSTFTSAEDQGPAFTDPMTKGNSFDITGGLGVGGGSITVDGEKIDLLFGLCADEDFTGGFSLPDTNNVKLFLGIGGDFDSDDPSEIFAGQSSNPADAGVEIFFYIFSYNGGSDLGSFDLFEGNDGEVDKAAFILAVTFGKDENGDPTSDTWFGTKGSATFAGSQVFLSGVEMTKLGNMGLGDETASLSGNLTCASFDPSDQ